LGMAAACSSFPMKRVKVKPLVGRTCCRKGRSAEFASLKA
jgi:hypothetical protein